MLGALVAGCGGGGGGNDLSILDDLDRVQPTVVHVTPSNGAPEVGTNSALTITFSELMQPGSLGAAIRLVDDTTHQPVALEPIGYDNTNHIATIRPQQPLAPDHEYRATIDTGATDLAGNELASAYGWSFTTAAGADTTPPTVTSHSPASDAIDVAVGTAVALAFSEPMDATTVRAAFELRSGGVPVEGTLAYAGQAAVFTPSAPLAPQTVYVARLREGAADLAGNPLGAEHVWSFTTGGGGASATDTTPPSVLGVTPADQSTNVPRDTELTVTFSEPIYPFLYGMIDGVIVDVELDYEKNTARLKPTDRLNGGVHYRASVRARDLAGNSMAAPFTWGFDTAP